MAGLILPVVADNSQEIGLYIRRLNSAKPTTVLVPFETMRACRRGPRVAGLIGSCVSLCWSRRRGDPTSKPRTNAVPKTALGRRAESAFLDQISVLFSKTLPPMI